jgi:coenzyme F420-0:L-glutamate ligase/coenzyme F420-1:gamma-L-glutamate ligase
MLTVLPVDGVGEVTSGDDLVALVRAAVPLEDGDVLVVTSKVVSKAEGRVVTGAREDLLAGETDRVVARRGPTSIVRTRTGLVMAAAGIDASNTPAGTAVLLPVDPDASARALRDGLLAAAGRNVAVVVTDTAGRAWRTGQTDIAVGVAGLAPLDDHAGRVDPYGNPLAVTAPAVADEVAAAADLVKGKLGRRPFAVARGLAERVLPAGEHGPGAGVLVRPEEQDMFGLGAREAVLLALAGDPSSLRGFGAPAHADVCVVQLEAVAGGAELSATGGELEARLPGPDPAAETRLRAAAFALGWLPAAGPATPGVLRFTPGTP